MRILVPIDGSATSQAAVTEVANRPWPAGTSIEVLVVLHVGGPLLPDPAFVLAAMHVERTHELERLAPEWVGAAAECLRRGLPDATVTTKILEGAPKDVIVREAGDWAADLIVMGCHGYGPVRRALLGSVAVAVVTHAPCSVEVVRPPRAA